jgi:hypothetical protein
MSNLELASLIDKISKDKHNLKLIKEPNLKLLIEAVINTKNTKTIIKELTK